MGARENAPAALAATLQRRMQTIGAAPALFDFGEIRADRSLKTNSFSSPIPVSDYQICRSAITDPPTIGPGTRVLVAWVGREAVIIGALYNARDVI